MINVEDFVKYMDNIIDSKKYSDRCVRNNVTFYCHKDLVDDAKKYLPGYEIVELKKIEVI